MYIYTSYMYVHMYMYRVRGPSTGKKSQSSSWNLGYSTCSAGVGQVYDCWYSGPDGSLHEIRYLLVFYKVPRIRATV